MTAREEFEYWWNRNMNAEIMDLHRCNFPMTPKEKQPYACHETQRAWLSWQGATDAANSKLEDNK